MKVGMLAPVAWRTPPRHYGPWELVTSLLTEQLVKMGVDVTLFATADSVTSGKLQAVIERGYEENSESDAKVCENLHISFCFEQAEKFDLIHNNFDFSPLCYTPFVKTPVVTTIHGFSSPKIVPVYKIYNHCNHYISISDADRSPELKYLKTIYHGIDLNLFTFNETRGDYLLFFGRMHSDKGASEAIEIARRSGMELVMAGPVQDQDYFDRLVRPFIDDKRVHYVGSVGAQERDRLLGSAYVLLHPINFNEPFGLSVAEAMACGTPTIAMNRGSMSELIEHGVTGFLVSGVDEAYRSVERVDQISRKKCRNEALGRFSVERMASEYLQVYKNIVGTVHSESSWGSRTNLRKGEVV